eukprot:scaffold5518_cov193-Ochromonas_danica.AAC.2
MLQDDRPPSQRFRIVKPDSIASLFAKQQQQQQQQGLSVNSTPSFLSTAREELRQEEEEEEEVEDYDDYDEDDDDVEEEDQDEEWQVSSGQSLPTVSTSGATTLSSPSPLAMTPSSLSSSIDMNKGSLIDESGDAPRVIVYNPQERIGGDRMQYGAYRNFHKPGKTKQRNKPKEKKNTSRKDSKATTTDSFYNSIRKLGRKDGPFTQGEPSKTTFADPPGPPPPSSTSSTWAKSNNIKSKKTPPSKGKSGKKVITPSEINSLFQSPEKRQEEIEKEDERDLPQWLVEANRERRKRLEARSSVGGINEKKKSKKLTDDWRFWLAIIGAVGMLNAAINVYQHTNMISGGGGVIM